MMKTEFPIKEIDSVWVLETGTWDKSTNTYKDRNSSFYRHNIVEIQIYLHEYGKWILKFINGPTGYESYYLEDLNFKNDGDFCICGGTINTWPRCTVKCVDINSYIKECGFELIDNKWSIK